MAKQLINTGTTPNDNTGDTLRQGALKVNANFNDIYSTFGDGTTLNPFPSNSGYANTAGVSTYSFKSGISTYASISGVSTNSSYFNGQLPSYYLNYANHTNTPTFLSQFTNNVGFITSVVYQSGFVCGGILTATSYRGDGSQLTGIATDVATGVLQAQINALGTNLNIVGFYNATLGIVTGLTIVGQGRPYIGLGQTLSSVGIVTGDYFIVSVGGTDVGIATYSNPGISSVYSGDWIVGVSSGNWSILSYSQQVVAPRATRADYARTLDSDSSVNTSGIITASQFWGNGGALTNLTSASAGTYGNSYTVPQVVVNNQGKITGITNVAIAITEIAAGYGTAYWSKNQTGLTTDTNVGIGTTTATETLEVYGNIKISSASGGSIKLPDAIQLKLGSSANASLFFDGSDYRFLSDYRFRFGTSSESLAHFNPNGSVELFYDGVKKFETVSAGATVTGTLYATSFSGNGVNLSGVVTSVVAGTNVTINRVGGLVEVNSSGGGTGAGAWGFSSVTGLGTTSNVGIGTTIPTSTLTVSGNSNITGTLQVDGLGVSGVTTLTTGRIQIPSSSNIKIGNSALGQGLLASARNIGIGDQSLLSVNSGSGHNISIGEFGLYSLTSGGYNLALGDRSGQDISTGSYNVILGSYSGNSVNLDIRTSSNNVVISDGAGNIRQYINSSGNVGIKTTIVPEALTVAGVVSATSFYGSLKASQLTGAMPAIDGSALLNIVSTGSGIQIRDDGVTVGTAATVDFGTNLNVSFASGIATVNSSIVGINTLGTSNFSQLSVSGVSTFTNTINLNTGNLNIADAGIIKVGSSDIFEIYRSGGEGQVIKSTSDLLLKQSRLFVNNAANTENMLIANQNGSVELYYDNSKKFETLGAGVTITGTTFTNQLSVSGVTTASSFSGSASGLTNLPSAQLTGALPAIDGSALLNVTAVGSGIVIKDDNVNVGSAVTVDFGPGLQVAFSAGIATVTNTSGSLQSRVTVSGVTTSIPNLGIGNTDITGFKSYALMKVGLSTAGWIRLYTDSVSRSNDATRSVGEDPAPGSGVIAEVVTTGISTTQIISPFTIGGDINDPPDGMIYVAIQNLSGTTQTITANLTILQLEA